MEPVFNFQGNAMLSLMAFAGTVLLLFALACTAGHLALRGRTRAARRVGMAFAGVAASYWMALIGFGVAMGEREVGAGGWKYFCEMDCHLAYSVAGVERRAFAGAGDALRAPEGGYEVVSLRVRFDPRTAGPNRNDAPLHPNPRRVRLIGSDGRSYAPSVEGLRALEAERGAQPGLDHALRPGESAIVPLVFELPRGATGQRLLLTESSPQKWLLIGHENSLFHSRTAFRLAGTERTAAR